MTATYEELDQFAGYFHEDYQLEYSSPDEAIRAFVSGQGQEAVRGTLAELEALLAATLDEDQLANLWISELAGSYDPRDDGLTYREWFAHVRELLTQAKPD